MKKVIEKDKIIVTFDESVISGSTSRVYSWEKKGSVPGRCYKIEIPGFSIMCAVSTEGDVFFQFLDGNNNQYSVQSFIIGLEAHLTLHKQD